MGRASMTIRYAARTDVGMRRNHNEDCFSIFEEDRLVLVADGMGGHAAGEVASGIATVEVGRFFHFGKEPWPFEPQPALTQLENRLACSFKVANRKIFETSRTEGGRRGMGTTLVALAFEGDQLCVAHVGDSRAYRIHGDAITRLTRDHSFLEQFKEINPGMTREEEQNFPHKNVITRALGLADDVDVDVKQLAVEPGDMFLLCSDGLSGHVEDEEILEVVRDVTDGDLVDAVAKLVERANEEGGNDNITAVLVRCTKPS